MSVTRRTPGPPYWLLGRRTPEATGRRGGYHDVFTVEMAGGRLLLLFGSEEAALAFLRASGDGEGWYALEAWAGELLSMLSASDYTSGSCAGVTEVAFDPAPGSLERDRDGAVRIGRRAFMDGLLGRGGRWQAQREGRRDSSVGDHV